MNIVSIVLASLFSLVIVPIALILIFGAISAAVIPIFSGYLIRSVASSISLLNTSLRKTIPQTMVVNL